MPGEVRRLEHRFRVRVRVRVRDRVRAGVSVRGECYCFMITW